MLKHESLVHAMAQVILQAHVFLRELDMTERENSPMSVRRLLSAATVLALLLTAARAADPEPHKAVPYKDKAGPSTVATLTLEMADPARKATVPVKIYYPKDMADNKKALPVIIFSHGLGGS